MATELATSVVYGYTDAPVTYALDSGWDSLFTSLPAYVREIEAIPYAAPGLTLNGEAVWAAAAAGDAHGVMNEICKGLSGQSPNMVRNQLGMHVYANYVWGTYGVPAGDFGTPLDGSTQLQMDYGQFLSSDNWYNSSLFAQHTRDFYGIVTMPFAAMGYWIYGNGLPRYADVRSLNLAIEARDFGPINEILSNPEKQAGTYTLSEAPFSYNTFKNASDLPVALTVGRVSGKVTGDLTINADGSYSFSGYYSLNDDKFDADPSNRPWVQEALTTFLMEMGETFGHTDYTIHFQGDQPVSFNGVR